MDVQNILYVLAFVIFFIIRTYNNYKKDEAKRQQVEQERNVENDENPIPEYIPRQKNPFEELFGEFMDIPKPAVKPVIEERSDELPTEKRYVETSYTEPEYQTGTFEKEYKKSSYLLDKPEEVRKLREKKQLDSKLNLQKLENSSPEEEEVLHISTFDLRNAIISQAILERPNY